jgi:[ribosomal protein S18]-alanine N-acetyltransferase
MTGAIRIEPAGLAHAHVLTALHAACFDDSWSVGAMADVLASPGAFACVALPADLIDPAPVGFALARIAADEAELLSLGVIPVARRQRTAQALLDDIVRHASQHGAGVLFLEVAETNEAARRLYAANGFAAVGRRPDYYRRPNSVPVAALTLRRALRAGVSLDKPANHRGRR